MSESNPTNETDDSITHDRSIPGNLPDPVMSPNNCVTTSYGQAGTSTLVSQPFSPTAPEFVSGATAHPSRAPGDSAKQDQVDQTSHASDHGGVLLKPRITCSTSRDQVPSHNVEETSTPSHRTPPAHGPHSDWTPGSDNNPTFFTLHGNGPQGNLRNPQGSRYAHSPFHKAAYTAQQGSLDRADTVGSGNEHLPFPNRHRITVEGHPDPAAARATFDPRYLLGEEVWNSPPKRLYSISVSPGRRDSDNSGLSNSSASASYHSGAAEVLGKSLEHDIDGLMTAKTGINEGPHISSDKHRLTARLPPDMNSSWRTSHSAARNVTFPSSAEAGAGPRMETDQGSAKKNVSRSMSRSGKAQNRKTGLTKLPRQLDPPGSTANMSLTEENVTWTEKSRNARWKKQADSKTSTDTQSLADGDEAQSTVHRHPSRNPADSNKYHQGPAVAQESQSRDQSLHIADHYQPFSATSLGAGSQQRSLAPNTKIGYGDAVVTGRAVGQQQSGAPYTKMVHGNVIAVGPQQASGPFLVAMSPIRQTGNLRNNVLALSLVNGQKYFMRPGFKGSTTLWPIDGPGEDQPYLCSIGEDGSVLLNPTSSAVQTPAQSFMVSSSDHPAVPSGSESYENWRQPLPDFGPIGPPNPGYPYGAEPGGQTQYHALSHSINPHLEGNQDRFLQAWNRPPSWNLPRSPIRTKDWNMPVAPGPPPPPQQGPLSYSALGNLNHVPSAQFPHSNFGRTESGKSQVWNPSRPQNAVSENEMGRTYGFSGSAPPASGSLMPNRYPVSITEISNVSHRALVPRSGGAWMASSSSPRFTDIATVADSFAPTVLNNNWERPVGKGTADTTSAPSLPLLPNRQFMDATFQPAQHGHPSLFKDEVLRNGKPTLGTAISPEFLPFFEATKSMKPAEWGVIKIGSIPYACTKQEILAFLGKNAKIITPEMGPAIHIMMDRTSGKTLDAYVEFLSPMDAQAFVNKLMFSKETEHRQIKVADRHCTLEVSSQAALMKELFPKAKNVNWNGQVPVISEPGPAVLFNSGFKCFISREELLTLAKHAESPHRSGCSSKSATRTYENMISILYKFPWFAVKHYTLGDRDAIYEAVRKQLGILATAIQKATCQRAADPRIPPSELTEDLLSELLHAGLNAPGFSEQQKWRLWQGLLPFSHRVARMSFLSEGWPWFALSRKPGSDEDVVQIYARIHHAACMTHVGNPVGLGPLFQEGAMMLENVDQECSMEEIGAAEWQALEYILRRVLS